MSQSSATARTDQQGDVFNAPLINRGESVYGSRDNTLLYAVAGIAALFIILKFAGGK